MEDAVARSVLIPLNDAPYGTERSYNGLRLAVSLAAREGTSVRVFLMGDATLCAKAGQKVASGFYNVAEMLRRAAARGAEVGLCGSCMDARGLGEGELVPGSRRSSLAELTTWVLQSDRTLVF